MQTKGTRMRTSAANRLLYWTVEVNLLLWLAVAGATFLGNAGVARYVAIAGAVFSAVFQHWAYYNVRASRPEQHLTSGARS